MLNQHTSLFRLPFGMFDRLCFCHESGSNPVSSGRHFVTLSFHFFNYAAADTRLDTGSFRHAAPQPNNAAAVDCLCSCSSLSTALN